MSQSLHNILIYLPEDLREILEAFNQSYFRNTFQNHNYIPHIGVLTIPFNSTDTREFIVRAQEYLKHVKKFEIKLEKFAIKSGKYIFWEPDFESKQRVSNLYNNLKKDFEDIYMLNAIQYYEERGEELSESDWEKIRSTGSKYDFDPHVSVLKDSRGIDQQKFNDLKKDFEVKKDFTVDKLYLTKESYINDQLYFPVIEEIELT